jgi:hypothetical protein
LWHTESGRFLQCCPHCLQTNQGRSSPLVLDKAFEGVTKEIPSSRGKALVPLEFAEVGDVVCIRSTIETAADACEYALFLVQRTETGMESSAAVDVFGRRFAYRSDLLVSGPIPERYALCLC